MKTNVTVATASGSGMKPIDTTHTTLRAVMQTVMQPATDQAQLSALTNSGAAATLLLGWPLAASGMGGT